MSNWPQAWTPANEDLLFDLRNACKGRRNAGDWCWEKDIETGEVTFFSSNLSAVHSVLSRNGDAIKEIRTWTFQNELETVELSFRKALLRSPEYILTKGKGDPSGLTKRCELFIAETPHWRIAHAAPRWDIVLYCEDRRLLAKFLKRNPEIGTFTQMQVAPSYVRAILSPEVVRNPALLVVQLGEE